MLKSAYVGRSPNKWVNILLSPFVLLWHALRIYVFGALFVYLSRLFTRTFCCLCVKWNVCTDCYSFRDRKFPPDDSSIGNTSKPIVWRRASSFFDTRPKLFYEGIIPDDVAQGTLGDCWLMSALVCMAEYPGLVSNCFVTKEYSTRGKYTVRLFDPAKKKWSYISVDDWFPCQKDGRTPMYSRPNGAELWVMVLEKAFAKACGSYSALDGGNILYAFRCLTGDHVFTLMRDRKTKKWSRWNLVDKSPEDSRGCQITSHGDKVDDDDLFNLMRTYIKRKALAGASITSGKESKDSGTGLVTGHAYSILDVKRVGRGKLGRGVEFRMVQLRNPWGEFEWKGDWSDFSSLWREYPKVKRVLKPQDVDDGKFWMCWEDFLKYFDKIDVCDRNVGLNDLYLDVKESDSAIYKVCGPTLGALSGCITYWFCCRGPRYIYFGGDSQETTRDIEQGRDDDVISVMVNSFMSIEDQLLKK